MSALAFRAGRRRGYGPAVAGIASSALILAGKFYLESTAALYGGLAQSARTRGEAEVGRRDPRYRAYGIESARWQGATGAASGVLAALQRRAAQIAQLETQFLATFAKHGGPTGAGSPGTNF